MPLRGGAAQNYSVTLAQTFQVVTGSVTVNGRATQLQNVKLAGDELSFSFTAEVGGVPVKHEFKGRADSGRISGSGSLSGSRTQGRYDWHALRVTSAATLAPGMVAVQ